MATKQLDLETRTKELYETMCRLLGEYINFVREEKGISLRELYRQTNISIAVLSDIENGQKLPRFETLIKLVLALDIPLHFVFGNKFSGAEFKSIENDIKVKSKKPRADEILRNTLLNLGYNKDEMKDIINFAEFTKFKRKTGNDTKS